MCIPLPPVMVEIIAVVQEEEKLVPQERMQQPTVEHAPVTQILVEIVEVLLAPTKRVQRSTWSGWSRVNECNSDLSMCECQRVQQRTAEQIEDALQYPKDTFEMARLSPQEHVQWIDEQMVAVPIPQIREEISEEILLMQLKLFSL